MKSTLAQGAILQSRYEVINKITTAGQSNIYKVVDVEDSGQALALKEMLDTFVTPQEKTQAKAQFHQQARILSSLNHPNLLKIMASFSERGTDYLVTEFIHGATLEELLYTTPGFGEEHQVIAWAVQLCDALDYLHSQENPIIFRDFKPANIMLDENDTIKLIDFGIARIFSPLKQTDTLKMGTLGYAPPEQYKSRGQTDKRSDIYALGATIHHLLTKRDPQNEPPFSFPQAKPRDIRPDLSVDIEKVVMKAVEYDKNNRQSSAKEFKAELLACSSIVVCPTCNSINAREVQRCLKDGTALSKPLQAELPLHETSFLASQHLSWHPRRRQGKGERACPVSSFLLARGLGWMYGIIVGIILGVISCPLIIVLGLIEGILKGVVIGILIGGTGILISRTLENAYGTFTKPETWLLVGIVVVTLSTLVYPMAKLINAHGSVSFYKKYCPQNHGRYAALVGLLAALSAIAYFIIKFMNKISPLVTRYMENVWDFLIAHI